MKALHKTRSVALTITVSIAVAALSVCALHAQAVIGQTQTNTSTTASGVGQTTGADYAADANAAYDPRIPPTSKSGALTFAQVLAQMELKNPALLAAEQNLRAVRAQELQAGLRENPYFQIQGFAVTGGQDIASYSAQFSRLFERGDKRKWRLEGSRATTSQVEAQNDDAIRQEELALKTAFIHMLIAKKALQFTNANLKDFGHRIDLARDSLNAGKLDKLNYEFMDLQLGDFESDQTADIIKLRQASDQLQTFMGIETPKADFDITGEIVPPNMTETEEQLVQTALAKRPDYAAARFETAAAIADERLAVANGTTDPRVETEYERNGVTNSVGFNVFIPLRIFNRNQGNKETTRYLADASRLSETVVRDQVISDVDQAWLGYAQAQQHSDRFSTHYFEESKDALSLAQDEYAHDKIPIFLYLNALRISRSTVLEILDAYEQTWLAIYRLSEASATELAP